MHRDHDKIALHIPKNDMFWQLEKLRHHGATYALKHVLNQKSEAYLHQGLKGSLIHKYFVKWGRVCLLLVLKVCMY